MTSYRHNRLSLKLFVVTEEKARHAGSAAASTPYIHLYIMLATRTFYPEHRHARQILYIRHLLVANRTLYHLSTYFRTLICYPCPDFQHIYNCFRKCNR